MLEQNCYERPLCILTNYHNATFSVTSLCKFFDTVDHGSHNVWLDLLSVSELVDCWNKDWHCCLLVT
jgi:hypothetical protein